jgi:Mlc titration factor MtfA (ptsG expression regulator)
MDFSPYFILFASLLISCYFIFRKKNPKAYKLSKDEIDALKNNVSYYQQLGKAKQQLFESKISMFLSSVKIEGVGLLIMPIDRILIASSAVIPIFGFEEWQYKNLTNVLLYPDTFNKDFKFEGNDRNIMGMVGTGYMNGQMILSQSALRHGFSKSAGKENTGIHEFVHLLDKSDGATDGIPEHLMAHEYTLPWLQMIHGEMKKIESNQSDINPYAITNEAEFFAVIAEYFFEKPELLKEKHPDLYAQLSNIFAQDLA